MCAISRTLSKSCRGPKNHRSQYIGEINRAYNEHFEDMRQYKHEGNFKRLLAALTLDNVRTAICRAESIMKTLSDNGIQPVSYKGYSYYRENPSLTVHEIIKAILKKCELI